MARQKRNLPSAGSLSSKSGKRHLNRSMKISAPIYERLLSLQGFLQLKEKRKRSMDELIEFILSFMPTLEIDAGETTSDTKTKRV